MGQHTLLSTWTASPLFSYAWLLLCLAAFGVSMLRQRSVPVKLTHAPRTAVLDGANITIADMIHTRVPSLYGDNARYFPTWWLPGGNLQTLWCVASEVIFGRDEIPYQRQYLRVGDGGTISLDIYPPITGEDDEIPVVFVLHGLTGSSQEGYIRATVQEFSRRRANGKPSFRVVALNFRGCDLATPVTSGHLYHSGQTDDTRVGLLWVTQTLPRAPIYGLGFSMGASTLAIYLSEEGKNTPMKGSVSISNPWDWVAATKWMEEGSYLNRYLYGPVLAQCLRTVFLNAREHLERNPRLAASIPKLLKAKYFTIRWFDDHITAPLYGFDGAWDYYIKTSSTQFIADIKVPHLSIHSTNDPMVASSILPWKEVLGADNVVLAHTHGGGHVGWFTITKEGEERRWFTTPIAEFLQALQDVNPVPKPPPISVVTEEGFIAQANRPVTVSYLPIDYKPDPNRSGPSYRGYF